MATPRIRLRDAGGTLRTLTRIRMRDAGGTLRTITRIRMRDTNGTLRIVYDPTGASTLAVAVSDDEVQGTSSGTGTATTSSVTATGSGGTGPYTYAWTLIEYSAAVPPTANSPSSAATTFTQTSMGVGEIYTSSWRVTVTDSLLNTATNTVQANFADLS